MDSGAPGVILSGDPGVGELAAEDGKGGSGTADGGGGGVMLVGVYNLTNIANLL